jgi:hypothetical protein
VPAPEILVGTRVVGDPSTIDAIVAPAGSRLLRIAPDDLFVLGGGLVNVDDGYAIVEPETMFAGLWLDRSEAEDWVSLNADWQLPPGDCFAQGMVAALPVKMVAEEDRVLVIVPVSFARELEDRL